METQTNTEPTYQETAQNFLDKHGIVFSSRFLEHGKHFQDDTAKRDIYELTLTRTANSQKISFRFGQSISLSRNYLDLNAREQKERSRLCRIYGKTHRDIKIPTPYDLLASMTKYSPGSFANFCSDFGYEEDSRKAEATWKAVVEEWFKVESFFTPEQLEELQEIN